MQRKRLRCEKSIVVVLSCFNCGASGIVSNRKLLSDLPPKQQKGIERAFTSKRAEGVKLVFNNGCRFCIRNRTVPLPLVQLLEEVWIIT